MNKNDYDLRTETHYADMPPFMFDFIRDKKANQDTASSTLYGYLSKCREFFNWLIDAGVMNVSCIRDIPLTDADSTENPPISLESLPLASVNDYLVYLAQRPRFKNKHSVAGLSKKTLNDHRTALKSLFFYLARDSENPVTKKTLIDRNVMAKVHSLDSQEISYQRRKNNVVQQMFLGNDKFAFLTFIDTQLDAILTNREKKGFWTFNKARNKAIIALVFASGLRVSEVVNANLADFDIKRGLITVTRKGNFKDTVNIAQWALPILTDYLEQRTRLLPDKKFPPLFVTFPNQEGNQKPYRIQQTTLQRFWKKWTTLYGRPSTPHKGRHTFATELWMTHRDRALVADALGQRGTSATDLYTHITDDRVRSAVQSLDQNYADIAASDDDNLQRQIEEANTLLD